MLKVTFQQYVIEKIAEKHVTKIFKFQELVAGKKAAKQLAQERNLIITKYSRVKKA